MATKTISIDLEAYRRLKARRQDSESFSEIIKRMIPPPFDAAAFHKAIRDFTLSDEVAETIEEHIRFRHLPSKRGTCS
jgi:predicted CopG family antitoxin